MQKTAQARRISLQEQEELGLAPVRQSNFVAPDTRRLDVQLPPHHQVVMDMEHPTQSVIHHTTSAMDRAKGFHSAFMPIAVAFGVAAVLLSLAFENEFFSLATLLIFWLTFLITWTVGWVWTNVISPEFAVIYSVNRQWNHIDREQKERWDHYKWLSGRDAE